CIRNMPNDVPMFGWAAHGVAMANAHPELKAVADEVTTSNEDDGVAVVLERLFGGAAVLGRQRTAQYAPKTLSIEP
ncbi:HAD family hydrolase, partial [Streptomyces viridosporus]|uniref:HAD family hydrolase n=1 Tax=Streptomyces viridosporus TaxID=67581 RepID=UPI00135884FC